MKRKNCFTIAIAGASGAGKSLLVNKISEMLEDSVEIYYDDYRPNYENLTRDLETLLRGQPIKYPKSCRTIKPSRFIVVEEPTGRTRPSMAENIDLLVYIHLPLDISLARILLRAIYESNDEEIRNFYKTIGPQFEKKYKEPVGRLLHIVVWLLEMYMKEHRQQYLEMRETLMQDADLIVDGMQSVEVLAKEVVEEVRSFHH